MTVVLDYHPLDTMASLANENATGELICASDDVEIHIYFQSGRIAWATDAARPLAFTRYLLETAQIDVEIFREILESCRREKRPLGETLVAWGVATQDEVRDALRHQIDLAVTQLRDAGAVQVLFLKRPGQFATYDPELTFGLEELVVRTSSIAPPAVIPAPPPPPPMIAATPLAKRPSRDGIPIPTAEMRLMASIDGVAWVETLEGTNLAKPASPAAVSKVPVDVVRRTLLDGAELVAFRMAKATLAGVSLSKTQSLWCFVTADATVGAIVASLDALRPTSKGAESFSPNGALWSTGEGEGPALHVLREFVAGAPEPHAAFITEGDRPGASYGVGRASLSSEKLLSLVDRRASAVTLPGVLGEAEGLPEADAEGLTSRRVMTAEPQFFLFAAEIIVASRSRFVWLVLDRSCSKGLGWGYITSLSRQIVRALRGD